MNRSKWNAKVSPEEATFIQREDSNIERPITSGPTGEHLLDEDGDVVLREIEVTTTFTPPCKIIPLVVAGIIVAIILLLLAIIFGILQPLGLLSAASKYC